MVTQEIYEYDDTGKTLKDIDSLILFIDDSMPIRGDELVITMQYHHDADGILVTIFK